jgi:hypothetical protein
MAMGAAFAMMLAMGAAAESADSLSEINHGDRSVLTIDSPRPVATVIRALASDYGHLVTYEDPWYADSDDMIDATDAVRVGAPQSLAPDDQRLIVPRGGAFKLEFDNRTPTAGIVQATLDVAAELSSTLVFRISKKNGYTHVIGYAARNGDGILLMQRSLLDTPISFASQPRSAGEYVEVIKRTLAATAKVTIVDGTFLYDLGRRGDPELKRYPSVASHEPARDVLRRALIAIAADRGPMSWQLIYNPTWRHAPFELNLIPVAQRH